MNDPSLQWASALICIPLTQYTEFKNNKINLKNVSTQCKLCQLSVNKVPELVIMRRKGLFWMVVSEILVPGQLAHFFWACRGQRIRRQMCIRTGVSIQGDWEVGRDKEMLHLQCFLMGIFSIVSFPPPYYTRGGLNMYGPHRFMCLNTWPIGSGTIRMCGLVE